MASQFIRLPLQGNVGTVTSVGLADSTGLFVISGSPVTGSGTLTLSGFGSGIVPIANGGTAVSSVTIAPAATAWAGWDANKNLSANNFIEGYTTTVTAVGVTTLVVGSAEQQYFTGTTTQRCVLPVVSTLVLGQSFTLVNNSTGAVTVQSSGFNALQAMAANTILVATVILTSGTGTASWKWTYNGQIAAPSSGVANDFVAFGATPGTFVDTGMLYTNAGDIGLLDLVHVSGIDLTAGLLYFNGTTYVNFGTGVIGGSLDGPNSRLLSPGAVTQMSWNGSGLFINNPVQSYAGTALSSTGLGMTSIPYAYAMTVQTTSIGPFTAVTPGTRQLYRCSVYLQVTKAAAAGTVQVSVSWTDDTAATVTATTSALVVTAKGQTSSTILLRATATHAVTWSATLAGITGTPQYAVDVYFEQLQ